VGLLVERVVDGAKGIWREKGKCVCHSLKSISFFVMIVMVHELILKGALNFEMAALPSYKDFFCRFLWYSISVFFKFRLVSSFKKCPFGLKTACFDSTLRCGS